MKATDDLFRLIKSLKQTEKRYFRLFSSLQKGNKNYLKLFNAISAQKEYKEEEIKKSLQGENLVDRFAIEKNNLHKLIMKSLRNYHAELSVDARIMELVNDAEILFHKSLYDQHRKTLIKARKLINKYERFIMSPLIISREWEMNDINRAPKLINEEEQVLEKLMNANSYANLYSKLLNLNTTVHQLRNRKEMLALDKIMKNELLQKENKALSFLAKARYNDIYSFYYELKANTGATYYYRKRLLELREDNPAQIEMNPDLYIKSLNNLCITQIALKKFSEAEVTIKKIKMVYGMSPTEDIRITIFVFSSILETHFYLQKGAFEEGIQKLKKIESGLKEFSGMIAKYQELVLFFNFGCLYFGVGDLRKARKWFNKVLNEAETVRQDLQSLARILLLIIDYESSGTFAEHTLKSIYVFLIRKSALFRFETIVLNYIKKLSRAAIGKETILIFKSLKKELIKLSKDPFEKKVFDDFDFISWVESKIENRPFVEVVKEKSRVGSAN